MVSSNNDPTKASGGNSTPRASQIPEDYTDLIQAPPPSIITDRIVIGTRENANTVEVLLALGIRSIPA